MTQEDKELLIKDLSGRLPYHPIVSVGINYNSGLQWSDDRLTIWLLSQIEEEDGWEYIKLYLRPMSSMTEEEKYQYEKTQWEYQADYCAPEYFDGLESYDWLNAHHFDYRGLIEKDLALEAPEGIYNS